jgi:hypothetical protein
LVESIALVVLMPPFKLGIRDWLKTLRPARSAWISQGGKKNRASCAAADSRLDAFLITRADRNDLHIFLW